MVSVAQIPGLLLLHHQNQVTYGDVTPVDQMFLLLLTVVIEGHLDNGKILKMIYDILNPY